jgi:glycosyltransferase involved in cell wall biosynthesis
MRILINTVFLTSEHLGGSWSYSANLVSFITRLPSPHEFVIMTNRKAADKLDTDPTRSTKLVVDLDVDSRIRRVAWEQCSLPRLVKKYGIDVVHSTGNVLPLLSPVPSIVTLHDLQYLEYPEYFSPLRRAYLRYFVPRSVHRATAVITISEFTKKAICRSFGVGPEKIRVTYLAGLPEKIALSSDEIADVRRKFDLRRPFFLAVGSSLPHKNLPRLIQAFSRVASDVPYDLIIVGDSGDHKPALENAIQTAGLSDAGRVRLLGFVSRRELVALYRSAEALVIPSLFEGFGIPAVEAMDCGCPVLAANRTALPEIVGDAGILFEPTDLDDIARVLRAFYHDSSARDVMSMKGRQRAREFDWEKVAKQTLELYEQVQRPKPS